MNKRFFREKFSKFLVQILGLVLVVADDSNNFEEDEVGAHVSAPSNIVSVTTTNGQIVSKGQVVPDGRYSFRSMSDQNKLLDLNTNNNMNVIVYDDNVVRDNQLWDMQWFDSQQAYRIRSVEELNLVLTWWSSAGHNVLGHDPQSNMFADSFWEATKNADGSYSFENKEKARAGNKSMMLDLLSGNTSNNTNVMVWEKNGARSQNWKLTPVSEGNPYSCVSHSMGLNYSILVTNNCSYPVFAKAFFDNGTDSSWMRIGPRGTGLHESWGIGISFNRLEVGWVR